MIHTVNFGRRPADASIKAVILDWAGTTVDHGSMAPVAAFIETFHRHGVEITLDEARGPMGIHKRDHIRAITEMPAVADRWQAVHGRPPDAADVAQMYEEFVPLQLEVIAAHAELIPGTIETIAALRERGIRIGSTTGYNRQMMDVLEPEAARRGFRPDTIVCVSDVPAGRPEPWMALRCAEELQAYPMSSIVKVGDTVPDIAEGLNAGMWTVAVALTGNELGLSEAELAALPAEELEARQERAHLHLSDAGAHYVIDSLASLPLVIEDIEERMDGGERP